MSVLRREAKTGWIIAASVRMMIHGAFAKRATAPRSRPIVSALELPSLALLQARQNSLTHRPPVYGGTRPADDDGDEYNELKRHLERAGDSGD